jgi:tetratricopeptide (TPR) repeat protein
MMKKYIFITIVIILSSLTVAMAEQIKLWETPSSQNKPKADYHMQKAGEAADRNDVNTLITHLKKAIDYGYKDPFNYALLADCYKLKGSKKEARQYYTIALEKCEEAKKICQQHKSPCPPVLDQQIRLLKNELSSTGAALPTKKEKPEEVRPTKPKQYQGLVVEGIMWDDSNPVAIINDNVLENGGMINGYVIKEIKQTSVIVEKNGTQEELLLQK